MTFTKEEVKILLNQEYAKKEQEISERSYKVNDEEDELAFLDEET